MKKIDIGTLVKLGAVVLLILLLVINLSGMWVKIPLRKIKSDVPVNGNIETQLGKKKGDPDVVTVTVCYDRCVRGTWKNIVKSAKALNGLTLEPGDDFSWLRDVGNCGKEEGYVLGGGVGGLEYGGGICFTATGFFRLMYSVKELEDDIHTYHHAHHDSVWYATDRNDATVDAEKGVDLSVKNESGRILKVRVKVNNKKRTITYIGSLSQAHTP